MSSNLGPEEARRVVLESSTEELWAISNALDRKGAPFPFDVAAQLVADVLEVGEVENWPRTTRASDPSPELFGPFCIIPKDDGKSYRSWMPADLAAEDEQRLRNLAQATSNPFVRARLFEVLWVRYAKQSRMERFVLTRSPRQGCCWCGSSSYGLRVSSVSPRTRPRAATMSVALRPPTIRVTPPGGRRR